MYVDSHCHLSAPELFGRIDAVLAAMAEARVDRALCICTTLEEFPALHALALGHANLWTSVGVHPDTESLTEPRLADLLARAALEHRSDDTADVIAGRLALYHRATAPIICWYRDRGILVSVDAMRPAQQIGREILTALDGMRPLRDREAARARHPGDLATLAEAFGVTGPAAAPCG